MINIPDSLLEKIKDILTSEPLDIYDSEEETITESNLELVDSRYETDSLSEEDRYYISLNEPKIRELTDDELELSNQYWDFVVNKLKAERFIRDTKLQANEQIRVVVDNTRLPQGA
jgi:hypothetical protein